jgi:hypothetical protein
MKLNNGCGVIVIATGEKFMVDRTMWRVGPNPGEVFLCYWLFLGQKWYKEHELVRW